jgi:glycosyltransferase involved in cell wall biosynthesis
MNWQKQLSKNSFLIGFSAANLDDPRKGLGHVVNALNNLSAKRPDLKLGLILIGRGKAPEIKNIDLVHLGYLDGDSEPAQALSHCDVAVNFSAEENLSMALIESLSVGTPVIALDAGGNSEVVSDYKTGFLVRDESELIVRIEQLADNPGLRRKMGKFAQEDFASRFTGAVIASRYLGVYRSLVSA